MLPLNRRTGVTEVEIGYDDESAMAEAQRCLHCWVNTIFEGNEEDGTSCILCGGCVDVCPENCLELVSLDRIDFDETTIERNSRTISESSRRGVGRSRGRRTGHHDRFGHAEG